MAEVFILSTIKKNTIYRSLSYKFFYKRLNDRKGRYSLGHFLKKLQNPDPESDPDPLIRLQIKIIRIHNQHCFQLFFTFLKKNAPEYIEPSGHFAFYGILFSSIFFGWTSTRWCSRGSPDGWIKKKQKTFR